LPPRAIGFDDENGCTDNLTDKRGISTQADRRGIYEDVIKCLLQLCEAMSEFGGWQKGSGIIDQQIHVR
jgi:hypothetical protein